MAWAPRRHPFLLALLMAGPATQAAPGDATHWVWQAVGADAPRQEHFVVHGQAADWLDAQGRLQWRLDLATGTLLLADPPGSAPRALDAAAVGALAAALAQAQQVQPGHAAPPRAWAGVEAADRWAPRPGTAAVAGLPCRRVTLQRGPHEVGEACIAEPAALPGGAALHQLLQALLALSDAVARHPAGAGTEPPRHPLVTGVRTGGLPLSVREAAAGGTVREWRLAAPPGPER
jgi:hypothetical protein